MECITIAKQLEGIWTVDQVAKERCIARSTAIKLLHQLRKEGFLQSSGGGKQKRLYSISSLGIPKKEEGMYDVINRYSKVTLAEPYEHKIIGRNISVEETIVRAIATRKYRLILATLGLFNQVKNWYRLYSFAKQYDVCHEVGALYDVARTAIKVRKMTSKIRGLLKSFQKKRRRFIIQGLQSTDFRGIESAWGIKIPLNKGDLLRYKGA
ncbi:hypothetical protein HYW21_02920 [Candidatus Woesearchaeota archaeon]|nr:hypothetical protein [Candidatus Woesearchaeota archaeon]